MIDSVSSFNICFSWDVSNVTCMFGMFESAISFNNNISSIVINKK